MESAWALFCLKVDVRVHSYKPEPVERSTFINQAVTSTKDCYFSSQETYPEHLCQETRNGHCDLQQAERPLQLPSFNCPLQTSCFHSALYGAALRGDSGFCRQILTVAAYNTLQVAEENPANFLINKARMNIAVTEAQHLSAGILVTTVFIPCSS